MAIGLSRLFGVRLPLNFNSPYKSRSIAEFWRRWHMTLSRFLRDYLYIPLGGNRQGTMRRRFNLMVTMLLGGMWHGAGWNFIIWGGLHGGFLVLHQVWRNWVPHFPIRLPARISNLLGIAVTFLCVVFAWVYFRAPDVATANRIVMGMLGAAGATLPDSIMSRLGPFAALFEALGTGRYLGGGAAFVETWGWITISALIAFGAPNTQQIMSRFKPAFAEEGEKGSDQRQFAAAFTWVPSRRNAIVTGGLLALGALALSRPTEFLYFQF
jgi:hypothetical protein